MKKTALIAAALAMVLSLAACGNRDNNTPNDQTNGNGTTENGGTINNNDSNSSTGSGTNSGTGTGTNSGAGTGTDAGLGGSSTGTGTNTGTGTGTGSTTGSGMDNTATGHSSVGSDLRRAADDVGDAVTGLVDDGRSALSRGTNTTSFQRMLNNARVHDTDGVLTDGENSLW